MITHVGSQSKEQQDDIPDNLQYYRHPLDETAISMALTWKNALDKCANKLADVPSNSLQVQHPLAPTMHI